MDMESEELSHLLFPNGVSEEWKDSVELTSYVNQLSSSGLDKLSRETAHLREERVAILDQTKDLAYSNYKTFIHTADCSKTICNDFSKVEEHLQNLSFSLPKLKGNVDGFLAKSKHLSQSRNLTSLTLSKHTQLLEILELPQLMDTCVRNNYFDEALEIVAYVRKLERKHPDISIIAGIVTEVQAGTRFMLNQLLGQLRSPLALPQCLKTVGLLRQLDVFTEPELRLKFLLARDSWMMSIIRNIPREDAYQHITKVIEAARVHFFDIVTQYRAIFCDDDARFNLGDPQVNEAAIFQSWITHKVNQFLRIIEKDLERGVGSNLEHVLAQCMYFGQSFSRIGADFRNLLIPMFHKAAISYFNRDVRNANHKFDETLSCFSLMETMPVTSSSFLMETQDKTRPSLTLIEFPPLGHYMNGLISAFNSLRQCCPIGIMEDVLKTLTSSLTKVVSAIVELHRLESPGFTPKEEQSFERMCGVISVALVPHVNKCLRLLMPLENISKITGIPVTQLENENFGQIDAEKIIKPIEKFLPKEELVSIDDIKPIYNVEPNVKTETNIKTEEMPIASTDAKTIHVEVQNVEANDIGILENIPASTDIADNLIHVNEEISQLDPTNTMDDVKLNDNDSIDQQEDSNTDEISKEANEYHPSKLIDPPNTGVAPVFFVNEVEVEEIEEVSLDEDE